jgi:hypothetical protein
MSGRASRDKGNRREREFAHLLDGQRVPLSGAMDGYKLHVVALGMTWQVKARANGWRTLYADLCGHDALAVKPDRQQWLVVIPATKFLEMVNGERVR